MIDYGNIGWWRLDGPSLITFVGQVGQLPDLSKKKMQLDLSMVRWHLCHILRGGDPSYVTMWQMLSPCYWLKDNREITHPRLLNRPLQLS